MKTHIALLRGVNVGGNKKVAMADLRTFVEASGFREARTLLQSGNLVFRSDGKRDDLALAAFLEEQAAKCLGLSTWFLVRSVAEWAEVIARNPFPEAARTLPSGFLVVFFREAPSAEAMEALRVAAVGSEVLHLDGKHLYAFLPHGIVDSKMGKILLGARFGKLATGRNWNTVLKLGALAGLQMHTA